MTKYEHLLELQESGELSTLFRNYELPLKYMQWMEIYAFHLAHPDLSQWQVAINMHTNKIAVWRAYMFMSQPVM